MRKSGIYTLKVNGTPIPAKGTFVYKWKRNADYQRCDHGYPINADVYHDGQWAFGISVDAMLGTLPHSCPTKEWMATLNHLIERDYFAPPQESDDTEYELDLECPDEFDTYQDMWKHLDECPACDKSDAINEYFNTYKGDVNLSKVSAITTKVHAKGYQAASEYLGNLLK